MDASKKAAIAARLEKIASLNQGRLTPDAVLLDAQNLKSPLHDQFEWDDSVAARQWRLSQARELIRSVRIEVTSEQKIISTVRYVRDPTAGDNQGYCDITTLRDSKSLARDALIGELKSAKALLERAHSIAEALGLGNEFEDLKARVAMIRGRLDDAA